MPLTAMDSSSNKRDSYDHSSPSTQMVVSLCWQSCAPQKRPLVLFCFFVCLFFFFFSPALVSQKIGGEQVRYSLVWETFHPRLKGKRAQESRRAKAVLRGNNYTSCFINECERAQATKPTKPITNAFVVLPYVLCVSERISRLLKQQSLQVSNKPQRTTEGLFSTTKTTGWN